MELTAVTQIVQGTGFRFELIFENSNVEQWHAILKERKFNEGMYFGSGETAEDAIRALLRVSKGIDGDG